MKAVLVAILLSVSVTAADAPTLTDLEKANALLLWQTVLTKQAELEAANLKWQTWLRDHQREGFVLTPDLNYKAMEKP